MKKLLALALSVLLVFSIFAGCAEETTPDTTTPDTSETTKTETPDDNKSEATVNKFEELSEEQKLKKPTNKADGDVVKKEHTVLIYMIGSNLESDEAPGGSAASRDILEMAESGIDAEKTNVVIYAGGAYSWALGIPSECNSVLALTAAGDDFVIATTTGQNVNMCLPGTLSDFLNYGYTNYPAESYSLIFWDHGGGSLQGFGGDDFYPNDSMYLEEFDLALKNSPFKTEKLKFIGFDACLMATYETALLFSNYADLFVASEEIEPGCGWDYSALSALNTGDEKAFAQKLLPTYEATMRKYTSRPEYTLSIMDLTKIAELNTAVNGFFNAAKQGIIDGNYSSIAQARTKSLTFANNSIPSLKYSYDLVDLADLATKLEGLYGAEAAALKTAIKSFVIDQVTNMKGANGVSIYFPYYSKEVYNALYKDCYKTISGIEEYQGFLDVYCDMWLDGKLDTDWAKETTVETPAETPGQTEADALYIQLTEEELKNVGRVYYNVFERIEKTDTYNPILIECQVEADASGRFTIPVDPEIVTLKTDLNPEPIIFQTSKTAEDVYVSQLAVLLADDWILLGGTEPVQISMKRNGNKLDIMSILSRESANVINLRSEVDASLWNMMTYYTYPMIPMQDQNGQLVDYSQWGRDESKGFTLLGSRYENEYSFEISKLSAFEGEYYAQVMIEDTTGKTIFADLVPLCNNNTFTEEEVATATGKMTFKVYEDHAELVAYEGSDETVTVPATVGGKNVTVIGESIFTKWDTKHVVLPDTIKRLEERATLSLESINLPEGLTYLGNYALEAYQGKEITIPSTVTYMGYKCLMGSELEKVNLPSGIESIGSAAFGYSTTLKEINISGNSKYTSVDGVLFSADKKMLVAYPTGAANTYTIPAGVEKIGYGAFYGDFDLENIVIPETVKEIDNFAFFLCEQLKDINLPNSVEIIGTCAFGRDIVMDKSDSIKVIKIGPNVKYIGVDAFSTYNISEYIVDENNPYFSSYDGCLLNVSGTKLIAVPFAKEGAFEVPYGVCYLAPRCLQDCNGITEITLPDSVTSISVEAGEPKNLTKMTVGAGLKIWNNYKYIGEGVEIVISENNPYFKVEGGKVVSK